MQDNKNNNLGLSFDGRGTVCIDTKRVLDCCRDRDCFEDARVYLTAFGEEVISSATAVRTKSAKTICAFVGIDQVPFNCGFYQIKVRYYIELEIEACLGLGRSQCIKGLVALEKDVVLYGGDGTVTSFSSGTEMGFCDACNPELVSNNAPTAIVDTVEPVVLGTRIQECCCQNTCCDCCDLPDIVSRNFDGDIITGGNGPRLLVSFGIFSVIRLVRPALLLVQATDYSVPDKECVATTNNENPCDLFRTMAFPTYRFQSQCPNTENTQRGGGGGCGCGR